MPNLTESADWIEGLYRLETTDPVLGGEEGIDNVQAKTLGARTRYLKAQIEALAAGSQPLDADLTAIAALISAADKMPYATGAGAWALATLSAFARTLLDDADAATARATLGAASPADVAAAIAALVDTSPAALDTLNELAAALGDDANFAATMTTALAGKQPLDADLTAIAALVSAADKMPYATGAGAWALATLSAFARTLLDDADAAAVRTTLGLGDVALKTMAADFASSHSGNGYQKLPGGLILQWGTVSVTGPGSQAVTFPIAFNSGVYSVVAARAGSTAMAFATASYSATGFTMYLDNQTGTFSGSWFAIGR